MIRAVSRAIVLACLLAPFALAAPAEAETRTLKLYFMHTGERAEITFKKNGRYVQSGLNKLNRFLRDWRRNEPTKMDPQLFDIIWEAYQMSGARDYIHVVSAYRSPATNEMLRRTRGGQAKKSQHMLGKAMDFYIPGVKLSKLREIGFKLQGGGVGYYPKSGSPFVHFDTGSVRAWPRMSRAELQRVFPRGGTLHLPPDGKPLPGYQQALAAYKSRKAKGDATALDIGGGNSGSSRGGGLLAGLFGGADEEEDNVEAVAPVTRQASVVRAQPQRAEPVRPPETPGTLMAALVPRETPLPQFAPRPSAAVPLASPEPAVETVLQSEAAPTPPQPVGAEPAPDMPLPRPRPEIVLASASPEPDPTRRTASEIEAALNGATRAKRAPDDQVEKIIASARESDIDLRGLQIPLPTSAPRPERLAGPKIEVASLPVPDTAREDVLTDSPAALASAVPVPQKRDRPSARIVPNYDTGVDTTDKAPRPSIHTASTSPAPAVALVPAEEIDPSRFGSWTTTKLSVTDHGGLTERPVFVQNALREAPTAVYTQGFAKSEMPDSRRFSGKAVTFLTVAKFAGGKGGDGQPLTLRLPITN
jgi:uncharacterized protein YcbK (DUF882 family)